MSLAWSDRMWDEIEQATLVAMRDGGADLAVEQAGLVASSSTPSGGAQRENTRRTRAIKRASGQPTQPLQREGRLGTAAAYRVRRRGNSVVIRPPADREIAVGALERLGYETIFVTLPAGFAGRLQTILDERTSRIRAGE